MKTLIKIIVLLSLITSASAESLKSVTVILDWFVNPDHAPIFVAEQQGYFKQQGLKVKIIAPSNPSDGPKLVAAGKADITISYVPALLQQVDQSLPLMRVGTLFPMPLDGIAVLQDSSIKSVKDLKGKTIGNSADAVDQAIVNAMLKYNGVDPRDVTFVNVNYNLVQALLTRKVDAVTGVMRNVEPIELQLAGHPARLFYPEENGVPAVDSAIWVVNVKQADQPWVHAFLNAIQQGTVYLQAHPQQTWQVFAKQHPELNNEFNQRSWMATYKLFAVKPEVYNAAHYQRFARFMQQQGLIKTVPSLNVYVAGSTS